MITVAEPQGEPAAWMRKWAFDGEKPYKEKNANGRMAWPIRFKVLPVTKGKHFADDVALFTNTAPLRDLSDEEIDKAWRSVDYTVSYDQFRIDVARAIIAAAREKA